MCQEQDALGFGGDGGDGVMGELGIGLGTLELYNERMTR